MRSQVKKTTNYVVGNMKVMKDKVLVVSLDGERYEFDMNDGIAENVVVPEVGKTIKGVKIRTNGTGDQLWGWSPNKGSHIARFVEFSSSRDKDTGKRLLPAPKLQPGGPRPSKGGRGTWYAPDSYNFIAILEILNGDYAGCRLGAFLPYIFERDSDGNAFIEGSKRQKELLESFMEVAGFEEDDNIPYSNNILPDLEKKLKRLSSDNVFLIKIEDGFVQEFEPVPAGMEARFTGKSKFVEDDEDEDVEDDDLEDEEDDDTPPPTKKGKSDAQKKVDQLYSDDDDFEDTEDDEEEEKPAKRGKSRKDIY